MVLTIDCFMPSEVECAEALRRVRWAFGVQCVYLAVDLLLGVAGGKGFTGGTIVRIVGMV
jgi:hypothetical protein